ncbi:MAG: DUF5132 domain-containing protein [Chloroflexota bacterium]|nr:DUF5132 domain-containing protein [Chloroflexota bacterium]
MEEFRRGARRGAGWAVGFGAVLGAASALSRGGQPTVKVAMKGMMRLREASAELSERVQDLYAEARAEYTAEMLQRDDGQHEGSGQGG